MSAPLSLKKRVTYWVFTLVFTVVMLTIVLISGLFVLDKALIAINGPVTDEDIGKVRFRTLNIYPYSMFHMGANAHHVGPMPWENQEFYDNFDVRSGDHGFFVEFDLDNPPAKSEKTFRVLLIGGSAAQGWGARTNDDMLYKLLEKELNQQVSPKTGLTYEVINLAMGGTITYQNFIALNRWGHALEPDLILSFSGCNDLAVPVMTRSDSPLTFYGIRELSLTSQERYPTAKWLYDYLPGVTRYTALPALMEKNLQDKQRVAARDSYLSAFGYSPDKDIMKTLVQPLYINALKSIKRDFEGIPMIVAFQPIDWRQAAPFMDPEYDDLITATISQLTNYKNSDWLFLNVDEYWERENLFALTSEGLGYGVHLPNNGQLALTNYLMSAVPLTVWQRSQNPSNS